jgi:hypothetical protein
VKHRKKDAVETWRPTAHGLGTRQMGIPQHGKVTTRWRPITVIPCKPLPPPVIVGETLCYFNVQLGPP